VNYSSTRNFPFPVTISTSGHRLQSFSYLPERDYVANSDFGHVEGFILGTMQDMLLLIANRKSHMSFPLVPKSVTLNDLERRNSRSNGPYFALFHRIW